MYQTTLGQNILSKSGENYKEKWQVYHSGGKLYFPFRNKSGRQISKDTDLDKTMNRLDPMDV